MAEPEPLMLEYINFLVDQGRKSYAPSKGVRRVRCLICTELFNPNMSEKDDGMCNACRDFDEHIEEDIRTFNAQEDK